MFYTYVLRCGDGALYVGSTTDLKRRLAEHKKGAVPATAHRLPVCPAGLRGVPLRNGRTSTREAVEDGLWSRCTAHHLRGRDVPRACTIC
ncbi:MAG: GIY-YIG nuclease family protein [Chthoniobacterales bacterium]|nr:GIY-YIG nuclease family protein [Chthoniobacterales bacterium]